MAWRRCDVTPPESSRVHLQSGVRLSSAAERAKAPAACTEEREFEPRPEAGVFRSLPPWSLKT